MRRVLSLAGAAALALLVGSASAEAQTMRFTALLSGANEVPGIASGSGGTATVTLNTATRAVTYKVDVYNMPSGTTQAHFHVGGPGVAGPVVVNFVVQPNISNDFSISGTATSADLVPRQAQGIGNETNCVAEHFGPGFGHRGQLGIVDRAGEPHGELGLG